MCNLQEDERLGGRIKLCEECLMPFTIEELKKKDGRWLCIETESNRDPCEPGNSSTTGRNSTSTSTSQQPEPGSWSDIFQQMGNQPEQRWKQHILIVELGTTSIQEGENVIVWLHKLPN